MRKNKKKSGAIKDIIVTFPIYLDLGFCYMSSYKTRVERTLKWPQKWKQSEKSGHVLTPVHTFDVVTFARTGFFICGCVHA